jgi:hypothetical protein
MSVSIVYKNLARIKIINFSKVRSTNTCKDLEVLVEKGVTIFRKSTQSTNSNYFEFLEKKTIIF